MAKRNWPRPDKDETIDLLEALNKRYERDLAILEETRAMRERTWTVNVPEELEKITGAVGLEYHDPTIGQDLESLPTLYTSKLPSLECKADARAGEKTVDDLTTRVEQFTTAALFEECGCREVGPPTHERLFEGVFSGAAVTMLLKRRDRWAEYDAVAAEGYAAEHKAGPRKGQRKYKDADEYDHTSEEAKKKSGVPVDWLYKDPMTIRPRYEGGELVEVIEVQQRDLISCLREYECGMNEAGEICSAATAVADWASRVDSGATVEFIQRWNAEWRQYLVRYGGGYEGAPARNASTVYELPKHTRRHGYGLGRPPYFITLGGKTKDYEFARLATVCASESKIELVKYVSFGRTVLGFLALRDALALLYETIPPDGIAQLEGDTGRPKQPEPYKLGTKYTGQPGSTLTAVTFPDAGKTLQAEVIQAEERLRRMGPTEVTGSLQGAGEAMATAFERDRSRVNRDEAAIVRHLTEVTTNFWKLIASLDEPVYVFRAADKAAAGYVKIDPDDFRTAVRPIYTLHVDSMAQDMIREQYVSRRVENQTLGVDQAIEMQGSNVSEVLKARTKDKMRESEPYQKAIEAEVQARWGRKYVQDQQMAEGIAAAGQPPPPPPGAPGQPPPGGVAPGLAVPPGANGQTSAGASVQPPGGAIQPGPVPGSPGTPSVATGAATAGVHGGAPGG